jgi:hypothetical protein
MSIKDEITERIGVHKLALAVLQELNWLEREQPISDHGIDLQAEIVENGKPTGMLYAIQVKSGKSYFDEVSDTTIVFRKGEKRHLDYWINYSLPVLLVLYHPEEDNLYWNFVTKENTKLTEKKWKIEIPKTNILSRKSKDEIKSFYINTNQFTILKTTDTSHALSRRISIKLLHKKDISDYVIKQTIPHIIEKLKRSDYYRNEIVYKNHKNNLADSIWVFTYKTLEQFKHGLPYCTAVWNNLESISPTPLSGPYECIDNNIHIQFGGEIIPDDFIKDNEMPKGKYLKIVDNFLKEAKKIQERIEKLFSEHKEENIELMKAEILKKEESFTSLLPEEYHQNFPPNECTDLDQEIQNINAQIDNIFIVIKDQSRDNSNIVFCIKMYLEDTAEHFEASKYERKKSI